MTILDKKIKVFTAESTKKSKYHPNTDKLSVSPEPSSNQSAFSNHPYSQLKHRTIKNSKSSSHISINDELDELISKTSNLSISNPSKWSNISYWLVNYINPLFLTALSAAVRLYHIDYSNSVVWDEAHFGKFGGYYLNREFYFDVHPPLGKLLIGLSEYLANFNGDFDFKSGAKFPEDCNFIFMRAFNCIFGILCTPVAYYLSLNLGFSNLTTWFLSLSVIFEMLSLTLSKFILLDSMLLFFTVTCYFCLIKLHKLRISNNLLSLNGIKWLTLTGISIGCVCSVKWVGLFITLLIGYYIIYDLLLKTYQLISTDDQSLSNYLLHWISRIITLILIPFCIYALCFKIHFSVLTHSGTGDGSVSTLLQASLEGHSIDFGPRSVGYGSLITMRSQGLSPNLIHSHEHNYPQGSRQQQITTYGFKDENNDFLIEFPFDRGLLASLDYEDDSNRNNNTNNTNNTNITREIINHDELFRTLVKDGDVIRLVHRMTGCLIRTHPISAPIATNHFEVSCFGDIENSNEYKDEWIIEVKFQDKSPSPHFQSEDINEIHPISTNFRLKNKQLGCYLATTGYSYPGWGFQQGEVVCKHSIIAHDKSTWWNIEDHINKELESPKETYIPPPPKFWKEFLLLNYGMMASNNALIPDPDKFDKLSSEWWEWPILHTGLRMCGWTTDEIKFFLIGNPFFFLFTRQSEPLNIKDNGFYLIYLIHHGMNF
ncbi:Dolichyl-phosphate-mannose-protein mannosyltransferase-domain-containing protein [Scheffersomyces amazonensis]|uniref:Dolichyl-phosphate-mannose-protein mannosyltransferase-domain-containing protein n=1 Tax=Scheffersomyces amazonensis TaxID=1078765 RepID=UPI00315DC832